MTAHLPEPPIGRDRIERAHQVLRRLAADAKPSGDPLTDEIRRELASGRIRGRDLLRVDAYREYLQRQVDKLIEQHQALTEDERRKLVSDQFPSHDEAEHG